MTEITDPRLFVPDSVSDEARATMTAFGQLFAQMPRGKPPETQAEFDERAERGVALSAGMTKAGLEALAPDVAELVFDGVTVLRVTPRDPAPGARPVAYIHGGGFVEGTARSRLLTAAIAAATSGRVVYSIDYSLAPRSIWSNTLDEVVRAWTGIVAEAGGPVGLLGDSAGGNLAAAVSLRLRDEGLPVPAALVLFSPLTDIAGEGDTNVTLAPADFLDAGLLGVARKAYASDAEARNPLVSPVHGDFAPGFPPTLIQVGTREFLLSDSVRLHRALRAAGRSSRLEVYEGMPHVFQSFLQDTPEGREAWAEAAAFWTEHLEATA